MSETVETGLISVPDKSLVLLIGPSGAGKTTFAARHFPETVALSSDHFRGLVSDDCSSQEASADAFEMLRTVADRRLARGRLTVIDATNVSAQARAPFVRLAKEHDVFAIAIVLNLSVATCAARNEQREDRNFGKQVVRNHSQALRRGLKRLKSEGFRKVHVLKSEEEIDAVRVEVRPAWTDRSDERGPFDLIGDIHGCFSELKTLLEELGYLVLPRDDREGFRLVPPEGRRALFLGDLVDRGPNSVDVLRLVMDSVEDGTGICVPGNHEAKLARWLDGKKVKLNHGLAETVEQMEPQDDAFKTRVREFIASLVSHFVLDDGRLVVAHAGMKERYQGRASGRVRQFALYGETTGETDEFGLPIRYDWAQEYRGKAAVVYGHTPVPEAEWFNNTICLDTGCVFGGKMTALRWPERELVSVPAEAVHCEPVRPLTSPREARSAQQQHDTLRHAVAVLGRRAVHARLLGNVTIREENATAALEAMSRFAIDPRWLIHLPPTMAPCETSRREGLLEHPEGAFDDFRRQGITRVACEEKHMGSRALVIACRDEDTARSRFGVEDGKAGTCFTRTGRSFFRDDAHEAQLVERVRAAAEAAGLWDELGTGWLLLDCELMPWSAKAQELLKTQYGPVGVAASAHLDAAQASLDRARERGLDVDELVSATEERRDLVTRYRAAWQGYCWPVESIDDHRLAPFHLLASEGAVHSSRPHEWHLEILGRLCQAGGPLLQLTRHRFVDLGDDEQVAAATAWWEELTGAGGEGMVVKPADFLARNAKGLLQPALKVRGREYLRIIYGPEYTRDEHLRRLRERGLGRKRSLALRELALGLEALERFVAHEPLRRVHECVFAVLALESEPVDPRL
ncbi:MAG: polynucleotide kinase-phosphatase [Acidobacteriota bacterium]